MLLALLFQIGLGSCAPRETPVSVANAPSITRVVAAMGTECTVQVVAPDRATALSASEAALDAIARAEARLSNWDPESELERWIAGASTASPALRSDLDAFTPFVAATEGAFDPRALDGDPRTVDSGGWGKGRALDLAAAAAIEQGAGGVAFSFGGQVLIAGEGLVRAIELADPRDRSRAVVRVEPSGPAARSTDARSTGASTSGQSERPGHLRDPRTPAVARAPFDGTVTVLCSTALAADALSTGYFVLGPDRALELGESEPGVEVLVIELVGDRLRVRGTSGLAGRCAALVTDLDLADGLAKDR
ncbi:Thiamine biosynthesis lipoprotein ApbE precursor [Planctomycetes bacterium Pla163]|uniref:FAD:protein FMN transferase n=1 Tax=Rohdeia mirabilis TaxID=2528008 RepID=A0A518CY69_9BACT|nr:Thiamine biosynthesis lipoprotein ApbE precursor [Planctomycetes bacterium Pla163]